MINRRIIRIKVMQVLYAYFALQNDAAAKTFVPDKELKARINQTRKLYFYVLNFIAEVARYAETDALQRSSKHIVTEADRNVSTKIAGNEILWKLLEDVSYRHALEYYHLPLEVDKELIKKMYQKLIATPAYEQYIAEGERIKKSELKILQFIFTDLLLSDESFLTYLEEQFENWDDDGEVLISAILQVLEKPQQLKFDLPAFIGKDKMDFAGLLLQTVIDKNNHLASLIKPKLKNWDEERVAIIDTLLLKMGISELLYFETIPPKVTINEYIDIAKEYSTDNSGQFINGTLDNIRKDLVAKDKLFKTDFKKTTSK